MDRKAILRTYSRYASRYDLYFGALFQPGRRSLIARMNCRAGEHVLEVGVGTGLSLPVYPRDVKVTGIDLSQAMLAKAEARRARYRLSNVVALRRMDAQSMQFADNNFDKVVAMYVLSVAPDPVRVLNEMRRVCKSDGELYVVGYFHRPGGVVGLFERLAAPLSRRLAVRAEFSLARLVQEARLEVVDELPVNLFGWWTLLRLRNNKARAERLEPVAALR